MKHRPGGRGFDSLLGHFNFHWPNPSGRSMALVVDSSSNRNEYQKFLLGVRRPVRKADNFTTSMCRLSRNSDSLYLLEPYGSVQVCKGKGKGKGKVIPLQAPCRPEGE